ncbi:MAG: Ig domain-containing protein, partial [Myxococcota bacterium]
DGLISATRDFTILVSEQSEDLEVVTRVLPPAFVDRPYEQSLTVYGGVPPYTWELRGLLPDGMVLDSEGVIRGRPMQIDLRMFPVRVVDALGANSDRILVLKVVRASESLRLATDAIPDGFVDEPYTATFRAEEATGTAPFTFSQIDGTLPDGLTLTGDTIAGTPTKAGIFDVTIRVTDADGENDANRFIIEIGESNGVGFLTTSIPDAEIGTPYTAEDGSEVRLRAISEQGSSEVVFDIVQGSLPSGLSLAADGVISGTPGSRGVFEIVVRAVDTAGQRSLRAFGLLVNDPPVPPPPMMATEDCQCVRTEAGSPTLGIFLLGLMAAVGMVRSRRRRAALLAAALVFGAGTGTAEAQLNYVVSQRTQPYVLRSGGTAFNFSSLDDGSATITLPFAFSFYGQDFTQVTVGTNGYVTFGGGGSSRFNGSFPSTSSPNNMIAVWWDDLVTTGEEWFVEGTAPNRVVTIEYKNAFRFNDSNSGVIRAQLRLFEGRSRFEIHYGGVNNPSGANSPSWNASAGCENNNADSGGNLLSCNPI